MRSRADGIKRNGAEAKEEKVTFLQVWQPPFGFLWGAASRLVLKFEVQPPPKLHFLAFLASLGAVLLTQQMVSEPPGPV